MHKIHTQRLQIVVQTINQSITLLFSQVAERSTVLMGHTGETTGELKSAQQEIGGETVAAAAELETRRQ